MKSLCWPTSHQHIRHHGILRTQLDDGFHNFCIKRIMGPMWVTQERREEDNIKNRVDVIIHNIFFRRSNVKRIQTFSE